MAHAVADARLTRLREWNSYRVDGSTLPTQGSANPALTIMALASRLAERLGEKRVEARAPAGAAAGA